MASHPAATHRLSVGDQEGGERLDRYVVEHHPELSRAAVQRLIDSGAVRVNDRAAKSSYRIEPGDEIDVVRSARAVPEPQAQPLPLEILHEDAALAVLNKPAGLVVHPAHGHTAGTLVNALLARYPELGAWPAAAGWPGIVHRLDRETSGLLLVARTLAARDALRAQFKISSVRKVYLALVIGQPQPDRARIEAPIARDPQERKRMAVVREGGRAARSQYQVLERLGDHALLEVRPETGRTHQIRVHLAAIGHPVAGDRVYGPRRHRLGLRRVFLHAARLTFLHPVTGQELTFSSPLPPELAAVLAELRRKKRSHA